MGKSVRRTHLYEFHRQNAKMVEFAGFDMPLWYKGTIPEHMAVRTHVGLFDITHMGRAVVTGSKSEAFLNYVTTNDVSVLMPCNAQYSTMCNENGGIKDDFIVSRLEQEKFLAVYNAANREKDFKWLVQNAKAFNAKVEDVSDNVAMFAVQGPSAQQVLEKIAGAGVGKIERFKCGWIKISDIDAFVSRTGYTGEDGFEVLIWNSPLLEPVKAVQSWHAILKAGEEFGMEPCGLSARDSLRLEAGMCLYGNDIDETVTPLEAGLGFVVKLKKESFIGKAALEKQKAEGIKRKRVGLKMLEKGASPRPKQEVWKDSVEKVGYVTSGLFSPLLECGVAQAHVGVEYAVEGSAVTVRVRDKSLKAEVCKFPLYDATKYGYERVK
ncbi:MAG TPA: glycine cleavage system aminomethyltransferase GcvT [Candidatus Bathyarchaeia archaeon]|nr:glycine cleavage system aminomethyltransferase GcvT [Candidatus Bathyarchaeia archaeon]